MQTALVDFMQKHNRSCHVTLNAIKDMMTKGLDGRDVQLTRGGKWYWQLPKLKTVWKNFVEHLGLGEGVAIFDDAGKDAGNVADAPKRESAPATLSGHGLELPRVRQ